MARDKRPSFSKEAVQRQKLDEKDEFEGAESASTVVRTALCVEAREGHVYVFVPPVPSFEAYLDLITSIEEIAEKLDMQVVVEGERPPYDPRIEQFSVSPDPGVVRDKRAARQELGRALLNHQRGV